MIIRLAAFVALALLTSAPAVTAQEQPRMGGVLKAGMIGEAPTLDLHVTTAVITQQITWHVYETLYTYDKNLSPIPMLAEGHAIADNGRRYAITLRKGVRFHNGKEMTSADVVPSLQHWAKLASPDNGAAIYPKEVLAAAGDGPVKEYIGTGPYRFVEHKPDRHVRLARFKDYSARSEPPNGYGGKRTAYIDEIYFIPVPEASVRLAGTETAEYNFALSIRQDQLDRIKGQPALEAQVVKPYGWITAVPNHKEGIMANKKVRQAFQAVLDMEPIMSAGIGNKAFYRLDGLQPEEQGQGAPAPEGSGLHGSARALDHHQGVRVDVQHGPDVGPADGGRGLQGRPPGARLGDARPAARQARALRHLLDGLLAQSRPGYRDRHPVQLAGLVVPRGKGQAPRRSGPGERPQEAPRDYREGPGALLRGRRAHQVRGLLRALGDAQGGPRLQARTVPVFLERLDREVRVRWATALST